MAEIAKFVCNQINKFIAFLCDLQLFYKSYCYNSGW